MKIAFIDPSRAYAADAPWQGPLGGTQSAVCYLARALEQRGHVAALYNHIDTPITAGGVTAQPWMNIFDGAATHYDALVLVGRWTAEMVVALAGFGRPVIGWMHEAAFDTEWIAPHPSLRALVFVSDWQHRVNAGGIPAGVQAQVIRNAISPFAEALGADENLLQGKDSHRVVFAGDWTRGLLPLVELWPQLHAHDPRLTLEIYCDPQLPGATPAQQGAFTARLAALPGLLHTGKVTQAELAAAMARATWHLSPNPYPETSCITLLEALALGCRSVVTERAALPESAHGFATLVPVIDPDLNRTITPVNIASFVDAFKLALTQQPDLPTQRDYFLSHYTWQKQADAWVQFVMGL